MPETACEQDNGLHKAIITPVVAGGLSPYANYIDWWLINEHEAAHLRLQVWQSERPCLWVLTTLLENFPAAPEAFCLAAPRCGLHSYGKPVCQPGVQPEQAS